MERYSVWEHRVDALIPYALVALLLLIIIEFLFVEVAHDYEVWINVADLGIIGLFTVDLGFKYRRVKSNEEFLKTYWMEIIAIIPFFLIFRALELFAFASLVEQSQEVVHARQAEATIADLFRSSKTSRFARFSKFLRLVLRLPRFAKAARFFREPK